VERYAFADRKSRSPAASSREAFWLTLYGILSGVYRLVVFGGILLFLADRFLILGIIMAVVCAISWVVVPVLRLIRYLVTDPRLHKRRLRASLACAGAAAAVAGFFALCPFPNSFRSPGVVRATRYEIVASRVSGTVREVVAASGARVAAGEVLLRMEDRELDFRIRELEAKLAEVSAVRQRALQERLADVKPVDSVMESISRQLDKMRGDRSALLLAAPFEGVWVAPSVTELVGAWIPRGLAVGQIVDDRSFTFSAVVSQRNVSRIFSGEARDASVRLSGQADITIATGSSVTIPMEQTALPSAALGLGRGGEVMVNLSDPSGRYASEPFYEVRLALAPEAPLPLFHGQAGRVRFALAPAPLLTQGVRLLRQLVQERYQL
jgi:putative peptide zinc metalloprotease protein